MSNSSAEARQQDLSLRNQLAANAWGLNGEKLDAILGKKEREVPAPDPTRPSASGFFDWFVWGDYATGTFENIDTIALRWVSEAAPDRLFEYVPDESAPFSFTTSDGRVIQPGRFLTDGGSIPDIGTLYSGIDRFGYLPTYLIHDWEHVLHHCGRLYGVTQEAADRALFEALKTMMATGIIPENRRNFWRIQTALVNFATFYWNADTACCLEN